MRRWNSICKRASRALLLLVVLAALTGTSAAMAATYNLSFGQRPNCSTSWSVSGSVFQCTGDGHITLGAGDVVTANSPATLVANNGFTLSSARVGSSANPIRIQSSYGQITASGAMLYGNLEASSGNIDLTNTAVSGSIQTGGDIDLNGGSVGGNITSSSNTIDIDGTQVQGTVTALGDIKLTDSSVTGKVTSTSNGIVSEDTDLLGGAQANNDIRITGGTLTGDITSTSNKLFLTDVTMTSGSLSGGTIRIVGSSLGGATGVVNANAYNGNIELINSTVVYGDLTAPDYAKIDVSDDSQVFGTCTPANPGCLSRPPVNCPLAVGLEGDYFDGTDLAAPAAFSQVDTTVDFDWRNDSPNRNALGRDQYSIRWSGYLRAPKDAPFEIAVRSDDGVRLFVDEFRVINEWHNHGATTYQATLNLEADRYYSIELEYYEDGGDASVALLWDITDDGNRNFTVIPSSYLVHCDGLLPTPQLEWRMDEPNWNGSNGEVADSSGNNRPGTGGGNVSTATGRLCRAGEFDGVDDFIRAPALYNALHGTASLSFWIRTTASGNNTPYLAPGISGIEQAGGTDDIFWGWLDASGHIGLAVGDRNDGKSSRIINDGTFHHVVLIRDASTGDYRIYIDGELDQAGRQASGQIGTYFESLGRVENTNGGPKYFQGQLDEVAIFEQQLSSGDVKLLYDLQRQGKNLDGTERDLSQCGGGSQLCINDAFSGALDGDRWQVGGTGYTPHNQGGRLRLTDDNSNRATAATLLQRFPSAGNRLQVEFDYYAYKNNGDDDAADGIALVLSDANIAPVAGGYGGSLGYAQNSSSGEDGFAGGWLGIGLDEFGNFASASEGRQGGPGQRPNSVSLRGSDNGGYRYLDGTAANLSPSVITGRHTPQRYRVTLDNRSASQALVTVERDADRDGIFDRLVGPIDVLNHPGQSAVPSQLLLTLTGSTGGSSANHEIDNLEVCSADATPYEPPIHHFELERSRSTGLTCEPLAVAVRACIDAACSAQYSGDFNVTLNASGPQSQQVSGNGIHSGDSLDLRLTVQGLYSLAVASSNPTVTSPSELSCFTNGIKQANCNVTLADAGLRFIDPDDSSQSLAVLDLVAGSQGHFRAQAVATNQTTGVCEGVFAQGERLTFRAGSQCSDPSTCLEGERVSLFQNGTETPLPNPQNTDSGATKTAVELQFGANSTAEFDVLAPDVGLQPLLLSFDLTDPDSDPSTVTVINEQINLRVRPAALRFVEFVGSKRTINSAETEAAAIAAGAFEAAGASFGLTLEALDANGIPTANFARTNARPTVAWSANLLAPDGGVNGEITASTAGSQWQPGSATSQIVADNGAGPSYSEVGVINLSGQIASYLPIATVADVSVDSETRVLGRFVPHHLALSQQGVAQWGSTTYRYQSQPAPFSGLSLQVDATSASGQNLANYDGDFFKLDLNQAGLLSRLPNQSLTGAALSYNASNLDWQRQDSTDYNAATPAQLALSAVNLTWPRKSSPDENDRPLSVEALRLPAAALTDSDGVCFFFDGDDVCDALDVNVSAVSLRYGRLNADVRASGTRSQVTLNVWTETLTGTDPFRFDAFDADGETSNTDLTGLVAEGQCRIDGTDTPASLCANIAASANGQLTGLNAGRGYFTINGFDQTGVVGVRAQVPPWLSWDWDSTDADATQTGPESQLFFGQFTGRPPLLFQAPGFR
ncbi:DUF6701 domain-containing protein [Saccharospirillum mangrovi]|uniref:DUF6701 domain-containing protein n=1 Tax=Saccharospirillum mangrovi TaxID=2161747 RepID=UPI0013B469D3|nr:DUF6701 domain-containing protein [Saccharospirillum mangrovi]